MSDGDLAWPSWLEDLTDRERLGAIMAAVRRCYEEHPPGGMVPTGPHLTTSMAEQFIGRMLRPTPAADLRAWAARIEGDAPGWAARMRTEAGQMDQGAAAPPGTPPGPPPAGLR